VPGVPFLEWPYPIPFAHRGGASDHPENTMPAFEHAVRLGYRYLETDTHVTADGVVVAFHDDALDRVSDRTGRIAELPWPEVAAAVVGETARVPRLDDLLAAFPEARINIDAKDDSVVHPLLDVLQRAAAFDRVCLAAFSDERIARMRAGASAPVCTALGPDDVRVLVGMARGDLAPQEFTAQCAQVPPRVGDLTLVDAAFVDAAHACGVVVHVWTVDDPGEMRALLDIGVDGIMTDRPTVLKDVLTDRDQWKT
jgi:glycerophosphoryl diester phosphodiesterase